MTQTKAGAAKARATILARHGEDFYGKIGKKGGQKSVKGGFAKAIVCELSECKQPRPHFIKNCAGAKGGTISRRGPAKRKADDKIEELNKKIDELEEKL